MFSMLLPLDATAARHTKAQPLPTGSTWIRLLRDCWNKVLTVLRANR
jgi:hypothetical protein